MSSSYRTSHSRGFNAGIIHRPCKAKTKSGKPCKSQAMMGDYGIAEYCNRHYWAMKKQGR